MSNRTFAILAVSLVALPFIPAVAIYAATQTLALAAFAGMMASLVTFGGVAAIAVTKI